MKAFPTLRINAEELLAVLFGVYLRHNDLQYLDSQVSCHSLIFYGDAS